MRTFKFKSLMMIFPIQIADDAVVSIQVADDADVSIQIADDDVSNSNRF